MVTHPRKDSTRGGSRSEAPLKHRAKLLAQTLALSDDEAARYAELTAKVSDEEAVRYVAIDLERARQHDEALREVLAEREAKREADAARGMREEFPAKLAVARSKLEECYRGQREPEPDEGFSRDIAKLAGEATLALAKDADLPKDYRDIYEDAKELHDNYRLFLAVRFLQGARNGTESEHTGYVLAVLARLYGDGDVHPLLGRAVEALRAFGGPQETRTPRQAIEAACGKSRQRRSSSVVLLRKRVRDILQRPERDAKREELERVLRDADVDARTFVVDGWGRGYKRLPNWGGPRRQKAKDRAIALLLEKMPSLLEP